MKVKESKQKKARKKESKHKIKESFAQNYMTNL